MLQKLLTGLLLVGTLSIFAQEKVTIAWDVSYSMQDRSTDKEFEFLDKYFNKYPEVTARVILFNGISATTRDFQIAEGNWGAAKQILEKATYDGASGYHTLTDAFEDGTTFLFTDGIENIEKDTPTLGKMLYVVNSKYEHDIKNLKFLALSNKGRFINMAPSEWAINKSIPAMLYTGNVYGDDVVPETVSIAIKGTKNKIVPSSDGSFKLKAKPGDILVVEAPGLPPVEEAMTENSNLNVWIRNEGVELEQVFIQNDQREEGSQMEAFGFDRLEKRKIGFAVTSLKREELNQAVTNISDAVEGRFTGVQKRRNQDLSEAVIRGQNTISNNNFAMILIDGVPIARSNSSRNPMSQRRELSDFIDPNNVADVTILKGYAATNQYGSEGSNGVILIKTKAMAAMEEARDRREEEKEQKRTNQYQSTIKPPPTYSQSYLASLKRQPNTNAARETYFNQREKQITNPNYFIDLFDFFATQNQGLAKTIGSNILEIHANDFAALRSLLFKAKEKKYYDMELDVAKAMLNSHPNRIQAYMDLAKAQENNGNYQAALDLLLAITKGTANPNVDFTPLHKTAHQEIRNLVASHKDKLELSKIQVKHLKKEPLDARIVFDWSDWDADFELTFVNPQRDFVTWKHTAENQDRLLDEQIKGYLLEEFEIAGGEKGLWQVNVKYLGNRTEGNDKPVFLRCLVQYGFGTSNERTEEYVLRLFEKGSEQLAVRLDVP
ncbi:TonB-dependent receptor plug domain-containing protein [Aureisphaera galaxeae]|uniref:TonB-dependent receptor plug domain-containing protein n=1 Tax=Aureisphaera galaxeae TaxID=1538023 RepID=UPI00235036E4|nr:TonB-dependent receptor plug domain-containing protein [Aureisphaera galaxeae]MDC8004028.1 TonB-dependent receptor plug domain-containing protein [Aureisphaera galaxeae]